MLRAINLYLKCFWITSDPARNLSRWRHGIALKQRKNAIYQKMKISGPPCVGTLGSASSSNGVSTRLHYGLLNSPSTFRLLGRNFPSWEVAQIPADVLRTRARMMIAGRYELPSVLILIKSSKFSLLHLLSVIISFGDLLYFSGSAYRWFVICWWVNLANQNLYFAYIPLLCFVIYCYYCIMQAIIKGNELWVWGVMETKRDDAKKERVLYWIISWLLPYNRSWKQFHELPVLKPCGFELVFNRLKFKDWSHLICKPLE